MSSFQPGIPTGTVNLDEDYKNIQNNFQQLDTTYGTDHVAYSQATNNGYHNIIRLVPNATPSAKTGIGQFFDSTYNDGINTDTTLYYLTGGNRLIQLTNNIAPSKTVNGYSFIPGGLIVQWGSTTAVKSSSSTTITFSDVGGIAFPNAIASLQITPVTDDNSTIRLSVMGNPSNTGFTTTQTNTSHLINLFWWAIGY